MIDLFWIVLPIGVLVVFLSGFQFGMNYTIKLMKHSITQTIDEYLKIKNKD